MPANVPTAPAVAILRIVWFCVSAT
jgi:hypothetical protein